MARRINYSSAAGYNRAMPCCTKCGGITGFVQFHPLRNDKEIRQCLNCEARFVFALDGSNDTKPSRKKR